MVSEHVQADVLKLLVLKYSVLNNLVTLFDEGEGGGF